MYETVSSYQSAVIRDVVMLDEVKHNSGIEFLSENQSIVV